ncbi:hypothetical protein BIV25_13430 [Streptomyces sp. MUSC 14]|uniref:hypothetical protein n=1 Tax=Streptomyces sp. MUSC 14 TaxID=1354889 RepID=UPI0008F5E155|nr:hypothetical protein [Streptomyces sp. MUSC 14]OIJ97803.1 hypothetical protein BIV25_13430 [Streptomyces sp. MUSC 14]
MNHTVGTEIEATAQWLEEHAAPGAAGVLRRVALQRDRARSQLDAAATEANRYRLSWRSARRRAEQHRARSEEMRDGRARSLPQPAQDAVHDNALMRVDLARFQNLVERAGWLADTDPRRLWRWRNGWWELAHRKRDTRDGYPDTGWYLWGPAESYFGQWTAPTKTSATRVADRLITQHLAAATETPW